MSRLSVNRGNTALPQFVDVASHVGLTEAGNSRGMGTIDLDSDGRLDLVVTHMFKGSTIYRNEANAGTPDSHAAWIGFELESPQPDCNRQALGSRVTLSYVDVDGKPVQQIRELQAIDGMSAQNDRRVHFGLGGFNGKPRVEVLWCGLESETFVDVAPRRYQKLLRGRGMARRLASDRH